MNDFKNKNIYFSGRGEKIDKEELTKYFIQHEGVMVDDVVAGIYAAACIWGILYAGLF